MKIVALAGGVGGAKLAEGLARCLPAQNLTIIVNTGDDFIHWGLNISPDLDTVCYTLAGLANPITGWGRAEETWRVFEQMQRLGAETWFRLGDSDLATHLERTRRLRQGEALSAITADFCRRWGVSARVLPMSDSPVATRILTPQGELPFQEYFVHQACQPTALGFRFDGLEAAHPAPGIAQALQEADALVFCPSNPWVSLDPILAVLQKANLALPTRRAAVSPIIGGQAVKGPAAKMFQELGIRPSAVAVAQHYASLLTGFILDEQDAAEAASVSALGLSTLVAPTLMTNAAERQRLAQQTLQFLEQLP